MNRKTQRVYYRDPSVTDDKGVVTQHAEVLAGDPESDTLLRLKLENDIEVTTSKLGEQVPGAAFWAADEADLPG